MKKRIITALGILGAAVVLFVLTDLIFAGVDKSTVIIDSTVYSSSDRKADIYPVTDDWRAQIVQFDRLEELTLVPCAYQLRENAAKQYEGDDLIAALRSLDEQCKDYTEITDISPLSELTMLKNVDLHGCRIHDLSPLQNSPVEVLNISDTEAELSELDKLPSLRTLYINNISEEQMQKLREKGITVILTDQ